MSCPKLLCVDDDAGIRLLYKNFLASRGYEVVVAASAADALKYLEANSQSIDTVITDFEMPGMNGMQLAIALKRDYPSLPVLMLSGAMPHDALSIVDAALQKGAPMADVVEQVEQLVAARPHAIPLPLPKFVPLGSVLAGVAFLAVVMGKVWR